MKPGFYLPKEFAEMIRVTTQTIRNWANNKGKIPNGFPKGIRYSPKVLRFPVEQTDQFVKNYNMMQAPQAMTPIIPEPLKENEEVLDVPRETNQLAEPLKEQNLETKPQVLGNAIQEEKKVKMVIKEGVNPFDQFNRTGCLFDANDKK